MTAPNKAKVNELFEAINREYNSKERGKVNSFTSAFSKQESFKIEDNPIMKKKMSD